MSARWFTCLMLLAMTAAAWAQAETYCPNGKDCVQIEKITPRVQADIALPADFTYTLQLKVQLESRDSATIKVRFERYLPKAADISDAAPALVRTVKKGQGRMELSSAPVHLTSRREGERLRVVAVLLDPHGKELAHSSTFNTLSSTVKLTAGSSGPTEDSLKALNSSPAAESTVYTQTSTPFVIRFAYSIKSVKQAWVNLEFGDMVDVKSGMCWYSVAVSLPQGTGIAEVHTNIYLSSALGGQNMGISLPLRLKPLGSSVSLPEIKPFPLAKPRR